MRRPDAVVLSVTVVLTAVVVAAVIYSLRVVDREPRGATVSAGSSSSVLAITWGPSLCKVEPANRGCRSGHVDSLGQAFVLHGLWPQPSTEQYCGVTRSAADRAKPGDPALPADLRANLQTMMSDATNMATHEWYAHGTCSGVTPVEYFGIAATLTDQAGEVLDPAFRKSQGQSVSVRAVRELFDARFGAGAGKRVSLSCRQAGGAGDIVYEVRLSLPPVVDLRADGKQLGLRDALAKAPTVPPGCGQARVP